MGRPDSDRRHDRHHCRRFCVASHTVLRKRLIGLGFEPPILEMRHGRAWGLRLLTSEHEQDCIKAMPNSMIESEAELPTEYPLAHPNSEHRYSSHRDVGDILRRLRIPSRGCGMCPRPAGAP